MIEEPKAELRLRALLATSWGALRAHPIVSASLGGAVVLSLASILFGIGALVTPWFVCEIFALQLSILTDRPVHRSGAWIRAGLLVLAMVGLVLVATWLAALAIGPDVATADSAVAPLPWPEALERVALIFAVTALTVGFITPFQYAPLILIERGGRIGEAVLESAWLVRRGGLAKHWALAFLAQMLPLAPALIAAVAVARTFERAATPLGVLLGLTLVPVSIPLGQGLLSAAYVLRARELPERRWTRAESAPPLLLRALLILGVLGPVVALFLLVIGALRPAPPSPGRAEGILMIERAIQEDAEIFVPDTTLAIHVDDRRVEVLASDGEGTAIALKRPVDRVRVLRQRDVYAIEAHAGRASWVWHVDRAGVRVDDAIAARLLGRLPGWALPAIALAFALSALLLVRALEPLGTMRRAYSSPTKTRAPLSELRAQRRTAIRRAWAIGMILAPASALALAGGIHAIAG